MGKKAKDNDTNKRLIYYTNFNDEGIKKSIVINANQMIDLNGKIDTFSLIDKALIDSTPILNITDNEGNKLNTDRDINYWLNEIDNYTNYLNDLLNADISKTTADDLTQLATDFNFKFLVKYVNGISLSATDLIGRRENYADYLARALVDLQVLEILKIGISKFSKLDLNNTDASFKQYMQIDTLKRVQDSLKDVKDNTDANKIKTLLYQLQILDSLKQVDNIINNNKKYYEDLHKKYEIIDNLIINVGLKYKTREDELKNTANYDIVKFKSNNDISAKLDPIAKTLLNGKYHKIDELIKTTNNYNDKSYSAIFSIKASSLSNIDIIDELKAKGIKINHFGKKIIDDIDLLLDENKGNITNNDKLVALTPKMIARKVYNKEQPTKKQTQTIEDFLKYISNIYLFFIKDDASADAINKLKMLKDKGIEILQDKEGNILNIGDTLDDNIILNAKYGWSAKYQSEVYVFDKKSIFYRANQYINNEVQKQLITSVIDKADSIFSDYNKNVNDKIVGIRYLLFERVNQIKHNTIQNNRTNQEVLLSNIYDEFDIKSSDRKTKSIIRNAIKNTLNYWVDINYINGYMFLDNKDIEITKKSTKEIYKIYINA